jgi:hypothetical protein
MNVNQQILCTLVSNKVIGIIREHYKQNISPLHIENLGKEYRLRKVNEGNFILESFCLLQMNERGELGPEYSEDGGKLYDFTYWKSHGLYRINLESNDIKMYIPYELEADYYKITEQINSNDLSVYKFSLIENAVIAGFSKESLLQAHVMFKNLRGTKINSFFIEIQNRIVPIAAYDRSYNTNGLKVQMLLSYDGFPQMFLDDIHELEGPISAYHQIENGIDCRPITEYKETFDFFQRIEFLSAFK